MATASSARDLSASGGGGGSAAGGGLAATMSWLFMEHFQDYGEWPWQHVNSFERQLQEHPSFLCIEFAAIALVVLSLCHACMAGDPEGHRRLKLLWLASFVAGFLNDYIFMLLPVVDNFWQAQAVVMLTPRMPLYIPCVYNLFMYWPCMAAARVFRQGNRCRIAEACLAGLLAGIFYAPYDLCGARFLWWTWHDSDAGVRLRWLGVPAGSTAWTITFVASFSFLLRSAADRRWGPVRSLGLACLSTPLMMVILNIFNIPALDPIGMPGPKTVALSVLVFGIVVLHRLVKPCKEGKPLAAESCVVRGALLCYFAMLVGVMVFFSPEDQISTGAHQVFGPCSVTDIDLMGHTRARYICRERYPDWYFRFDCPSALPGAGRQTRWEHVDPVAAAAASSTGTVSWYTVCGQPHESFKEWLVAVTTLAAVGSALFLWALAGGPVKPHMNGQNGQKKDT